MLTDKSFAVGLPIVGRKDDLLTDPVLPAFPLATVVRQLVDQRHRALFRGFLTLTMNSGDEFRPQNRAKLFT
jgi:hypothetical protein